MTGLVPAFIAELTSLGVQSLAEAIDPRLGKVVGFFKGVWKRYRGKQKKAEERAEVERIARLTAAQVVAEVRPQLAAAFPANVKLQQEGELYFAQMPGAVRASLKRKDDPSGRSAPADHDLDTPEKLAVLFPAGVPQLRPGDDLPRRKGVWKLLDLIGAGGFGEVWKVRNVLTKQFAAAKFCTDPNARLDHIRHELEQALRLNHDDHGWPAGVVPVLEFDLTGDHPWILFQFVEGGTLEDLMHELAAVAVPQRVARAVPVLAELAGAVAPLHALSPPLVHRDLKPANVLRDAAGKLMVTDLGLGGSAVEYELSLDSQGGYHSCTGRLPSLLQGSYSLHYASKQQRAGDRPTTPDDVYALGVIAYQMLAGKLDTGPGTDADEELAELGVPEPLVKLVKACASDDPKRRPANAAALVGRLKALTPVEQEPHPPAPSPGRRGGVQGEQLVGSQASVPPAAEAVSDRNALPQQPLRVEHPLSGTERVISTVIGGTTEAVAITLPRTISPAFADALCRGRLAVPISQRDAAKLIGVTLACVNNWERMYASPSLYMAARAARILGLTVELRAFNRVVPVPSIRREDLRPQNVGRDGLYQRKIKAAKVDPANAVAACRLFADRVEQAMQERGITERQLSGLADVSPTRLRRVLDGDRPELVGLVPAANIAHSLGLADPLADYCEPQLQRVQP